MSLNQRQTVSLMLLPLDHEGLAEQVANELNQSHQKQSETLVTIKLLPADFPSNPAYPETHYLGLYYKRFSYSNHLVIYLPLDEKQLFKYIIKDALYVNELLKFNTSTFNLSPHELKSFNTIYSGITCFYSDLLKLNNQYEFMPSQARYFIACLLKRYEALPVIHTNNKVLDLTQLLERIKIIDSFLDQFINIYKLTLSHE